MKRITLLFTLALLSFGANAQISVGPAVQAYLTDYIWKYPSSDEKLVFDMSVGALSNIPLSGKWHLQPGLFYTTNGLFAGDPHNPYPSVQFNINALEIPVNITYKTQQKNHNHFIFSAGPFLAINLGGKEIIRAIDLTGQPIGDFKYNLEIGSDTPATFRRIAGGFGLNAGYELKNGLSFRLHYHRGIINMVPSPYTSYDYVASQNMGVTLVYMFGLNTKSHPRKKADKKKQLQNNQAIRNEYLQGS